MLRKCSKCGHEAADLARFCSNCGLPLTDLQSYSSVDNTGTLESPFGNGTVGLTDTGSLGGVQPGTALLIVRKGPSEGMSFTLQGEYISVGRGGDASIMLDDVTVSRRHAEFLHDASGWTLRDLGSLNGTYVNRNRISSASLKGGEEIQIGKYRFVFLVAQGGQG